MNAPLQDAGTPTVYPSDDTIVSAWSSSPLGDPAADVNRPTIRHYDSPQPPAAAGSFWSRGKAPLIIALVGALGAGAALGVVLLDTGSHTTTVVPGAVVGPAAAPGMIAPDLNASLPSGAVVVPPAVIPAPVAAPPALGPAADGGSPAIVTIPVPDGGTPPVDPGPPPPPDAGPPPPPDAGPPPVAPPPVIEPGPVVIINAPGPHWGPPPPPLPPLPPPPAPHVTPLPPPPPPPVHFTPVPAPPPHLIPMPLLTPAPPPPPPHFTPVCTPPTHFVNGHCS